MPVATVDCPSVLPTQDQRPVRYEIHDRFTAPRGDAAALEVWCPIVPDSPYQRVLDLSVSSAIPWTFAREPAHGNLMLHARLTGAMTADVACEIRYVVERLPVTHMLHPGCARPLDNAGLFARHLAPEQFVDVNDETRRLGREVVGAETNALLQARRIYDHVAATMTYDAANQSWKGSTEHALVCAAGNCNDIHALFISLCRSVGIPARLVLGQAFEPPPPGQEACELCGYHCWAEFFAAGLGWVPVDASCACKYGKHHLFGTLEMNHVAWSVGRDLTLAPMQEGPPLLFFAAPYGEADGVPLRGVERHIAFAAL